MKVNDKTVFSDRQCQYHLEFRVVPFEPDAGLVTVLQLCQPFAACCDF